MNRGNRTDVLQGNRKSGRQGTDAFLKTSRALAKKLIKYGTIKSIVTGRGASVRELTSRVSRVVAGISISMESSLPPQLRQSASRGGAAVLRLSRNTTVPLGRWESTTVTVPMMEIITESSQVYGGFNGRVAELLLVIIFENFTRRICALPGFAIDDVTKAFVRLRWLPPIRVEN